MQISYTVTYLMWKHMDTQWYLVVITVQVVVVNAQIGEYVLGCTGQNVLLPCAKNFDISSIGTGTDLTWDKITPRGQILKYTTGSPTFNFSVGFRNTVKYDFNISTYSLELKSAATSDSNSNYDCSTFSGHSLIVDVTIIEPPTGNLTLTEVKMGTEAVSNGSTVSAFLGDNVQITANVPLVMTSGTIVETPTITVIYDGLTVSTCTKSSNSSHSLLTCSVTVNQQSAQICITASACTVNGTTHCFQIKATSGTSTNPTVDTTPEDTTIEMTWRGPTSSGGSIVIIGTCTTVILYFSLYGTGKKRTVQADGNENPESEDNDNNDIRKKKHIIFQVLLGIGPLCFAGLIGLDFYIYSSEGPIRIAAYFLTALAGLMFILMCVVYYCKVWKAECKS